MVEETNIVEKYAKLKSYVQDYVDVNSAVSLSRVVQSRLHIIDEATDDAGNPFNAAEQIHSLQNAQKELGLLRGDFLSLQVDGSITESQYELLVRAVDECDESIRAMSDPEFS